VAAYCLAVVSGAPFVGHAGGDEVALLYLVISVLLLTVGSGRFPVDDWLRKKRVSARGAGLRPRVPRFVGVSAAPRLGRDVESHDSSGGLSAMG